MVKVKLKVNTRKTADIPKAITRMAGAAKIGYN